MDTKQLLQDALITRFTQAFGPDAFTRDDQLPATVTFPAAHPAVGPVRVVILGAEAIVAVGDFSHGHFDDCMPDATEEESVTHIAESVTEFLRALFAGKFILWKKEGSGGWWHADYQNGTPHYAAGAQLFRWSGPVSSLRLTAESTR